MKLLLSVLDDRSADRVAEALVAGGFAVTRLNTVGGFLRRGNATLLSGVPEAQVEAALELVRRAYDAPGAPAGQATAPVFVLPVELSGRV